MNSGTAETEIPAQNIFEEREADSLVSLGPSPVERKHTWNTFVVRETDNLTKIDDMGIPTGLRFFRVLESSTTPEEELEDIGANARFLFEAAKEEVFEDGIERDFEAELADLITRYGDDALAILSNLIIGEQVCGEVACEALQVLGRIFHPPTYEMRLWLLERSLFGSSAWIRDGAVLGLAWLDDPHATRYLRRAIEREQIEELREDMEQVLVQLETH